MGYHFWIFVITASYIANLANIYISNEKIRVGIATIDDANTQSANVCVMTGGGAFNTNNGQGRCFDCYISGTPYDIANLTYASTQLVSVNSGDILLHTFAIIIVLPPTLPSPNTLPFAGSHRLIDRSNDCLKNIRASYRISQTTLQKFSTASTTDLVRVP